MVLQLVNELKLCSPCVKSVVPQQLHSLVAGDFWLQSHEWPLGLNAGLSCLQSDIFSYPTLSSLTRRHGEKVAFSADTHVKYCFFIDFE